MQYLHKSQAKPGFIKIKKRNYGRGIKPNAL